MAKLEADPQSVVQESAGLVEPQSQQRSKTCVTERFHRPNLVPKFTLEVDCPKRHVLGGLVITKDQREVAEVAQRECPRPIIRRSF